MKPIDVLREDFSQTLGFIDKCDDHIFKIKNWALFTSSAVIAFSVTQNQYAFSLANIFILVAFIYLELIYKLFQDIAIVHSTDISERIDKYLADPSCSDLLDDYNHSFGRKLRYPSARHVFSNLVISKHWHILGYYSLLALFSVGAFLLAKFVN